MNFRELAGTLLVSSVFSFVPNATFAQSTDFVLHDGDRVTFYGDSITYQREYTRDVEEYVLTRFPAWKVSFHNVGVDGDKVSGGIAGPVDLRLERDVFSWRPSMVTIMLGMNDGYYRQSQPGIFSTYADGYRHIVDSIGTHLPQANITLIQPSPFDDVTRAPKFRDGYNSVLVQYGEFLRQLSQEKHTRLADFNAPMIRVLGLMNTQSPDLAQQLIPDRVHPQEAGHWLMAESLLKSWNAAALVSSISLDLSGKQPVAITSNASVADIHRTKSSLRWTETEAALPLPFGAPELDPVLALTLKVSDIVTALDQELLQVRQLPSGSYDLLIDDEKIAMFSADQLSTGVNLATLETPMLKQSRLVDFETRERNEIESARFDLICDSLDEESSRTAAALAAAMPAAEARLRADARPQAHHFELALRSPMQP
ncbi:MAG: SGNH/GDSL hydrolase family protein [Terriglobia bacterium]|jgi:lysophospholipase L1-like esterase